MRSSMRGADRLSKRERQERILSRLGSTVAVRISDLAEEYDVTTETIRRDLDALARRGLLARTYGGAAMRALAGEPGVAARAQTNIAERRRIGLFAAGLIKPGDVILVDAGSTTTHFADALAQLDISFTVITNSLGVARILGQSETASVMLCPGEVRLTEEGVFGPDTLDYLDRYNADAAFIGAGGFTLAEVSDADASGVAVKRKMITRAARIVLLADRTKAGVTQYATVCPLDVLDLLVTDARLTDEFSDAMQRSNVEVLVAPEEPSGSAP